LHHCDFLLKPQRVLFAYAQGFPPLAATRRYFLPQKVTKTERSELMNAFENRRVVNKLAAVSCRYHGSASQCKPRPDKAAYGKEVLNAWNGRSKGNGCSCCNTSPFEGESALKDREAGSSKACAGACVSARNRRIEEVERLQSALWVLCNQPATEASQP